MNKKLRLGIVWFLANVFFFYQFILRLFAGILKPDIMHKFQMNDEDFGALVGYYYLGYALMQIPFGILLDKFSFRLITSIAIATASLGTLFFANGETANHLIIGRFLMGTGSGVAFLACAKITQEIFIPKYHSIMFGFTFTFGLIGAVFGLAPMHSIFSHVGYSKTMYSLVGAGVLLALTVLVLGKMEQNSSYQSKEKVKFRDILSLVTNYKLLIVSICGGLMVGSLEGFADVWVMPFFREVYNIQRTDTNIIASFIYVGMCFGAPLLPMIANIFKSEELVIILSGITMCLIFVVLFNLTEMTFALASFLMFILGVMCTYQVLIFSLASKVGHKFSSLAIAFANSINMSFGHFFHITISSLVQKNNIEGLIDSNNIPIYSRDCLVDSLSIIVILCLIAQIGFAYLFITSRKKHNKKAS